MSAAMTATTTSSSTSVTPRRVRDVPTICRDRLQTHRPPQSAPSPHGRGTTLAERVRAGEDPSVSRDRLPMQPCPPSRPRSLASSRHLVGLLTHELGSIARLLAASGTPRRCCNRDNGSNATALSLKPGFPGLRIARIQRRGRPGFTPEFPVRLSEAEASGRPPESMAECIDEEEAVNKAGQSRTSRKVCQARCDGCQTLTVVWQCGAKR